ncbi:hypothetical protein E2F47_27625 [Mycobacterium eburneum]|nr:hypothetical protein [Mycobacterium eburneum]TDH45787.1 hypothetical protein E2F47_27625 [Mycobacterium eburneum]
MVMTLCDCAVTPTPERDLDEVASAALLITERLADDRLWPELLNLCRNHPAKAAQVIMCLAAWHDGADAETLAERARDAAEPRVDWRAVEWVCTERIPLPLNQAERREVVRRLADRATPAQIGTLIGITADAVTQLKSRVLERAS